MFWSNTYWREKMKTLFALSLSSSITTFVFAETFTVDDDGKADYATIQEAIDAASDGDEIIVMPGTYTGSPSNEEPVVFCDVKSLNIRSSEGKDVTFIDGENKRRCLRYRDSSNENSFQGFTLVNGYNETNGAGISVESADSVSISDCVVENCSLFMAPPSSTYGGAGIYIEDSINTTFTDCTVRNNSIEDAGYSSTFYGAGILSRESNVTLNQCEISGNRLVSFEDETWNDSMYGSGIYFYNGVLALGDCTINDNGVVGLHYSKGGGIYAESASDVTIEDCLITNNKAWRGAGIYIKNGAGINMLNTNMNGNILTENSGGSHYGGGAYLGYLSGNSTFTNCEFNNNTYSSNLSTLGCGIFMTSADGTFISCKFNNNIINNDGNVIYLSSCNPQFDNCEFSNNENTYNSSDEVISVPSTNGNLPIFSNCTFENNNIDLVDSRYLGGDFLNCTFRNNLCNNMLLLGGSIPAVTNFTSCTFEDNEFDYGVRLENFTGGSEVRFTDSNFISADHYSDYFIYSDDLDSENQLNVNGCLFEISSDENKSTDGIGIAYGDDPVVNILNSTFVGLDLALHVPASTTIDSCIFNQNRTAIFIRGYSQIVSSQTITDCVISNNRAGITCDVASDSYSLSIIDSEITHQEDEGIGIFTYDTATDIFIDNCLITKNEGYGLTYYGEYAESTIRLQNTSLCSNWPSNYNLGYKEGGMATLEDIGGSNLWNNCLCESGCSILIGPGGDFETIEEGINNTFLNDELVVEPGIYSVNNISLKGPVNMRSTSGSGATILQGNGKSQLFVAENISGIVNIEGFTFRGGRAFDGEVGGAMSIGSSLETVNLSDCVFTKNNCPTGQGGAIYCRSPLVLNNVHFNGNSASEGGGLYMSVDYWVNNGLGNVLTMNDCSFVDNNAESDGGGLLTAIDQYKYEPSEDVYSPVNIQNSIFTGNNARVGGAYKINDLYASDDEFTNALHRSIVSSCTFDNNHAEIHGGSIASSFYGNVNMDLVANTFVVENCSFSNCSAASGGAVYMDSSDPILTISDGAIQFSNCTFSGNESSENGGAIACYKYLDIVWTSFINNASFRGGSIYIGDDIKENVIQSCTFDQNEAVFGGSIYVDNCLNAVTLSDIGMFRGDAPYGGGLYNNRSEVNIDNSKFGNNSAYQGGGIFTFEGISFINNTLFSDNNISDPADVGHAVYNLISYSDISNTKFCGGTDSANYFIYGAWGDVGETFFDEFCEDCDGNGVADSVEIKLNPSLDCDLSGIIDQCEIDSGISSDCNGNGIPDTCDIENGLSTDCNSNNIPDDCEIDCDQNGIPDDCDIANGALDCNNNYVPDECEIDCNENGTPDDCDITNGLAFDCNENGIPDSCDIENGSSLDSDFDGVPDECQCLEDVNMDGLINVSDLLYIIADWGSTATNTSDINNDGIVNVSDLLIAISAWGVCE